MKITPWILAGIVLLTSCEEETVNSPDIEPGRPDSALFFGGVSSTLLFPNSTAHELQQFTVELMVRFDTLHATMIPLLSATGINQWNTADGYSLKYEEGKFYFGVAMAQNVNTAIAKDTLPPVKKWIHLSATYDRSVMKLYMDGILVAQKAETTTVFYSTLGFELGHGLHSSFGENRFKGWLDELRLWNTARTHDQIGQVLNSRLMGNEAGLVGYWDFDRDTSAAAIDQSFNNDHGTLVGDCFRAAKQLP